MARQIVLLDQQVFPAWMVAAIVVRELLISGLRQAAVERGVVIAARDLAKVKTWAQAVAAAVGGFAAAGAWGHGAAWWTLLVALVLTVVPYTPVAVPYFKVYAVAPVAAAQVTCSADPPEVAFTATELKVKVAIACAEASLELPDVPATLVARTT